MEFVEEIQNRGEDVETPALVAVGVAGAVGLQGDLEGLQDLGDRLRRGFLLGSVQIAIRDVEEGGQIFPQKAVGQVEDLKGRLERALLPQSNAALNHVAQQSSLENIVVSRELQGGAQGRKASTGESTQLASLRIFQTFCKLCLVEAAALAGNAGH